ncbi:MAG TPA: hypothetical protein VM487_23700, partial [Phycisphaerae bacterium]|nr:hypothetical protein [Phycisphaerae bacterium]
QEESVISGLSYEGGADEEAEEIRASGGGGAIAVASMTPTVASYVFDKVRIYCTLGNTEQIFEIPTASYELYLDNEITAAATGVCLTPDAAMGSRAHPRYTNSGGEPPASTVGCFDGSQAVYCLADKSVEFSIPNFPTMVPRLQKYTLLSAGNWDLSGSVEPQPWRGKIQGAFSSAPVCAAYGGNRILICTAAQTFQMVRTDTGRLLPRVLIPNHGCQSAQGMASTGSNVHILSNGAWMIVSAEGFRNASRNHWATTINALTSPSTCVVAHYSHLRQVWLAEADDIYIIDDRTGQLLGKWTIEGIGAISAMCEQSVAGSTPVMRVASSTGHWTYDPDVDNGGLDDGAGFDSHWEAWFGQEDPDYKFLEMLTLQVNTFDGTSLAVEVGGAARSGETVTTASTTIAAVGQHLLDTVFDGKRQGRMFKVKISSTVANCNKWALDAMTVRMKPVDERR